jgi:Ca2+-binding RTX toxin-like protein
VMIADISNVEDVTGSRFGDTLTGTSVANILDGGKGDDTLNGAGGDDTLLGGEGNDHLRGGSGANIINGGDNNDTITLQFEGIGDAAHRDTVDGGYGSDTLAFTEALPGTFGVSVKLSTTEAAFVSSVSSDGHAFVEATVTGIENVTGTDQSDVILGDEDANQLIGNGGDDVLQGGAGLDYLDGGDGKDRFVSYGGDRVADEIHGGGGIDTVDYTFGGTGMLASDPDRAVIVRLADNGQAGSTYMVYDGQLNPQIVVEDRLFDIENITGSARDDSITGNGDKNVLLGGFGVDKLDGGGNDDTLNGGPGHDTLTGGPGADLFQFTDRGIGPDGDTITDFLTGVDRIDFSGFYSQATQFHNHVTPPPTFIGDHALSGNGNELRVFTDGLGNTIVQLQTGQDLVTDPSLNTAPHLEINLGFHTAISQTDFLF